MKIHDPAMTFAAGESYGYGMALAHWQTGVENNQDPYGNAVYRYASEWATRMEQKIKAAGIPMDTLVQQLAFMTKHAKITSHEADDEGITGFMYGCAVSVLARCWVYGEALRRWHNKDTQIGNEGDRANDSGTVLNPAILNIG